MMMGYLNKDTKFLLDNFLEEIMKLNLDENAKKFVKYSIVRGAIRKF